MSVEHPGFRIFVLGAGFSKPAGLPLGHELFPKIASEIRNRYGTDTKFERDLSRYIDYRKDCDNLEVISPEVDLEDFMSYLDIEHFLYLRGSDTWSEEGNESQIMVRQAIGRVIHNRTPRASRLPNAYHRFAERLSLHDIIITFNYDIVLERALEHVGKPYRLFPNRYKTVHPTYSEVDSEIEEVTVFKLHGSVDWFSDRQYLELKKADDERGLVGLSRDDVFDEPMRFGVQPLVEGPRSPDDPLQHIHRIGKADEYYSQHKDFHAPFILSPSHVKFVYSNPLRELWYGIGQAGGLNLGISVIGYSLPAHDEYIRVALYQLISNYQRSWWNMNLLGVLKDNVKFIDYAEHKNDVYKFKKRYRFVNGSRAEYSFDGFGDGAIPFLFDQVRVK